MNRTSLACVDVIWSVVQCRRAVAFDLVGCELRKWRASGGWRRWMMAFLSVVSVFSVFDLQLYVISYNCRQFSVFDLQLYVISYNTGFYP